MNENQYNDIMKLLREVQSAIRIIMTGILFIAGLLVGNVIVRIFQ